MLGGKCKSDYRSTKTHHSRQSFGPFNCFLVIGWGVVELSDLRTARRGPVEHPDKAAAPSELLSVSRLADPDANGFEETNVAGLTSGISG